MYGAFFDTLPDPAWVMWMGLKWTLLHFAKGWSVLQVQLRFAVKFAVTCHVWVPSSLLTEILPDGLSETRFFVFNPLVSGAFWSRAGLENMWWIWKCQVYAGASFNEFKENWPEKGWSSCFEDGASCFKLYRPSPGCAIRCEKTAVLLAWWRPSPCLSWPFHTKDKGGREEAPRVAERTLRAYGVVSYSTLE